MVGTCCTKAGSVIFMSSMGSNKGSPLGLQVRKRVQWYVGPLERLSVKLSMNLRTKRWLIQV